MQARHQGDGDVALSEGRVWFNRIADRAQYLCERCGKAGHSVHHRKKRSQGGEWTWENLAFLCGTGTTGCHGWVEHNPNDAEWEGWHVRPWQNPADVVVKYQGEWARLTEYGDVCYGASKCKECNESGQLPRGDSVPTQEQAS